MKKITSTLIMLVIMLFAINVKASNPYFVRTDFYKVSNNTTNTGDLYNSMPTEIGRDEIITVRVVIHDANDLIINNAHDLITWDEGLELVETNGKYYTLTDNSVINFSLEIAGDNKIAISYGYEGVTQTNDINAFDLKFKVKKDTPDGIYKIRREFQGSSIIILTDIDNGTYVEIPSYEKTLKYQVGKIKVSSNLTKEEIKAIDNDVYIIGNYMFTREGSDLYDGTLTTPHIMLASKSIESNNTDDMKIYLKDVFGDWVNAINDEAITPPDEFKIYYIDMIPNYAENGVYTDVDETTILRLIQISDKEAIVTIESVPEKIHGLATVNGKTVTLTANGVTYTITVGNNNVNIATNDNYLPSKNLNKRSSITLNEYLLNEYIPGIYDGYGSPLHYIKSAHSGKYYVGNYELDVLRVSENTARVCLKEKGSKNCVIDKYAVANHGNYHSLGNVNTTYAFEFGEDAFGLNWSNNQMGIVCLSSTCVNNNFVGMYSKDTNEINVLDALHIWEKNEVQYQVTFDANNGVDVTNIYVPSGKTIDVVDSWNWAYNLHDKDGYMFVDWKLNQAVFNINTPITSPITLIASYVSLPGASVLSIVPNDGHEHFSHDGDLFTYKLFIALDENYDGFGIFEVDGSYDPVATATKGNYAEITVSNGIPKRYYAKAYLLDGNNEKQYGANSESILVYPQIFEVVFNTAGGSAVPTQHVPKGEFAVEPTGDIYPTKDGYTFIEWQKDGVAFDFENERINGVTVLVATWENDIKKPQVGITQTTNYYDFYFKLDNLNSDYCTNANGECTGLSTDNYKIDGFELYEIVNGEYVSIYNITADIKPYETALVTMEPNSTRSFALRAYGYDGAIVHYSDDSDAYEIDTTLQQPVIAFNPNYQDPTPSATEGETWVQVTNLISAFGFADCQISTCASYKVNEFEIYEKVNGEYNALGTFGPTGAVRVTALYGQTLHLYVRGVARVEGKSPEYTPYSNELVFSPTAPVVQPTEYNGVYVLNNNMTIKLYDHGTSRVQVYMTAENSDLVLINLPKNDEQLVFKYNNKIYEITKVGDNVELDSTNEAQYPNGTYERVRDYTASEYYYDNFYASDSTYLSEEMYNDVYTIDNGTYTVDLYMFREDYNKQAVVFKASDGQRMDLRFAIDQNGVLTYTESLDTYTLVYDDVNNTFTFTELDPTTGDPIADSHFSGTYTFKKHMNPVMETLIDEINYLDYNGAVVVK